jgi:RimJ/RimL family protein N-acetyltransferase
MAFYFPTRRLIVRMWRDRDRPALERMTADAEMMRFITGRPWADGEVDELLERQRRHLGRHGVCFGAVEHAADGVVVGLAGMQPLDSGDFELGWWVWKDHWGRGYAAEAAQPFLVHARNMGCERLFAVIDPQNSASIRVAEKLGMRFERTARACETISTRGDRPISLYALDL